MLAKAAGKVPLNLLNCKFLQKRIRVITRSNPYFFRNTYIETKAGKAKTLGRSPLKELLAKLLRNKYN